MNRLNIYIIFLTLLSLKGLSQGLYDQQQKFYLIKSGISKVNVFANNKLSSVWHIDSSARTIAIYNIQPSIMNPAAPKYDNKYSISNLEKYFFNNIGNIDSIVNVNYELIMTNDFPSKMDSIADTTIINYSYPLLENWVMNRKLYSFKIGQKRLVSIDYFGYDSQKRLILLLQDEGRVQCFYSYNDKGQIEKEDIWNYSILYKYNSKGQITSRVSETQKIKYEYNESHLLIRETVSGNNAEILTYEYK